MTRIDYTKQSPEFFNKMIELSATEKESSIEEKTLHLVHIRASQMNGCGFCLDIFSRPMESEHPATEIINTLFFRAN
ncbi:carboxymuconolactone decarboxylase family protein [Gottfriedia luciferensis]|uniref:carboxymuconolactone decarboxylase family protein n=1 Tax=Gottfriedia luciferensis TaxID=178774 RepID=UPI000B44D6C1|nr:carboxymuconolactone decarboxylase family protein [Gottfriedia luciferensis]